MDPGRSAINVLLADDNDDDVVLVRETFESTGLMHVLHVVSDGAEAIAYLLREGAHRDAKRPQLVLLDINMPNRSGFDVLEMIKGTPSLRAMPVIMLTGSCSQDDIVRSYAGGACSFISKPSSPETMAELANHFSSYWCRIATLPPQE